MFKPSELPAGTRIDDKVRGFWTKDSPNAWFLDDPHCGECSELVLQGYPTPAEQDMMDNVWKYHDIPADEFFKDFKIICFPFEIVEMMAKDLMSYDQTEWHTKSDGSPFTTEGIIRDAIEEFNGKD